MNLYQLTVPQFEKTLHNVERWIDKAEVFAKTKNFDANTLLVARLAPDQYPLVRQIQTVCDNAKFACSRLSGKEMPKHPDTETTWDEIRTRIKSVLEYVKSFKPSDFEGAEERKITMPWMPGKYMTGKDYVTDFVLTNFYFHATTAFAILRKNGVDLGKMDFVGSLPFKDE
jgi:hypothetical protein